MIRHLLQLAWNRKRSNALILLEIFLSFIVLFAICSSGLYFYGNFNRPLGFSFDQVWVMNIDAPEGIMKPATRDEGVNTYTQLINHIRSKDEVIHAASVSVEAYGQSSWGAVLEYKSRPTYLQYTPVSLDFEKVMDLEMLEGRFWEYSDLALSTKPIVVNEALAEDVFEGESALNKVVQFHEVDHKIIGVFRDYRHKGDFSAPDFFAMIPHLLSEPDAFLQQKMVMKVEPGTTMNFEESLIRELEAMAPGWSFKQKTMERMRRDYFKLQFTVMAIFILIAVFMLTMVCMGLVGVLWQNVTRRTSELGVRRAKGATRRMIYLQILGELMIITTIAILMALVIAIQLPILGMLDSVGAGVLAEGFGLAMLIIYFLTTISGLYPSWLATRINPAEALHYE